MMTEREYDAIQYDLSKLLKKVRRGYSRAYGKREEAYEEGVLACKSAISRYNPNPYAGETVLDPNYRTASRNG